jgi:excisionase family DNA binding protein
MQKRKVTVLDMAPETKLLLSVEEAAALLSLGRTLVYGLMTRGEIQAVKVGRARRVVAASLHEYIGRLTSHYN